MGPRSCKRGNTTGKVFASHAIAASMGPRSCKRGNNGGVNKRGLPWLLQWGRALASAEINIVIPLGALAIGFNGAALLQARKYHFLSDRQQ